MTIHSLCRRFAPGIVWVTLLLLTGPVSSRAQVVNPAPMPHWITVPEGSRGEGAEVLIAREFVADGKWLKVIAQAACDPPARFSLNGHEWEMRSGVERAESQDVSAWVRPGTNRLEVRWKQGSISPLLAFRLELNADGAGQKWMITDRDWSVGNVPQRPVRVLVRVDQDTGANPFDPQRSTDAYNSWKLALKPGEATPGEGFQLLPGFRCQLIRSATSAEGSWVAMAFDGQGRLTLAREKRGLLRLSLNGNEVERVDVVEDTLLECRGLLHVGKDLYANANNSKKLCRLEDRDGDGKYEIIREVLVTEGGVGHGRNHLKLGPDGWIHVAHGNNVLIPKGNRLSSRSSLRRYAEDQLSPCSWDATMFDGDVTVPAGHVLRVNPDTGETQLFAGGFRNPLDIAFNRDGEMFTFDADMEWDIGTPWYMPNRVLHVVSGSDYGFRRGTGRFPASWPDTLPGVVDIGLASPTAVVFGTGTRFPERYRDALYICDWAYGRILAVHLKPVGASYRGEFELFASARPFNVTDLCVGPDGALWCITGGRGTQSGLYRISWSGGFDDSGTAKDLSRENGSLEASRLRELRRSMERYHNPDRELGLDDGEVLEKVWPLLGHDDRHVRYAARVALENVDAKLWKSRLKDESSLEARLSGGLALARVGDQADQEFLLTNLLEWSRAELNATQRMSLVRTFMVSCARNGMPGAKLNGSLRGVFEGWYPNADKELHRVLGKSLAFFGSGRLLPGAMEFLRNSVRGDEWLHEMFLVRNLKEGWTSVDHVRFLESLRSASAQQGGKAYFQSLDRIREEFLANRTAEERESLRHWLEGEPSGVGMARTEEGMLNQTSLPLVKKWEARDLVEVAEAQAGRPEAATLLRGRLSFVRAQCGTCHRVGNSTPGQGGGAMLGPDLSGVGSRFNRRDLLMHILQPSLVVDEKFRQSLFEMKDGQEISGVVSGETAEVWVLAGNRSGQPEQRLEKASVVRRRVSEVSPMPVGLLDVLTRTEISDLLMFLQTR